MIDTEKTKARTVTGGVDTHKDLHVAAVVDDHNRVLATASFPATRQGYGRLLAWMQSHGDLHSVGVEYTGSYGAGLLRHLQRAGVEVLEVTTPDRLDRRRKGKDDDLDAQNAAHAAFAGIRTVTPRSRNGMVEALRVLKVCRKSAVAARKVALQMILTAGDNSDWLASEASFAALCGFSPVPASSGKTIRHRLNRGGGRAANSALHIIAVSRMRLDQRTKEYVARRIAMGHSKLEAIRMIKRYIAREVFGIIRARQKEIDQVSAAMS